MAQRPPIVIRVLFVEDSQDDVALILRELAQHGFACESKVVETRGEFLAALRDGPWDVILSDHSMASFSSTEALHLLRDAGSDVPFIIVSGTIGEDAAVEAMRAGAHDYVLKHNLKRLGPAVERELREAANRKMQRSTQEALQSAEQRLRHAQRMESVGRLAGGIAHDFNNLLTVILGYTEFMLDSLAADHPAHADAGEIRTAAERATRLTRQLLAFSRQQVLERRVVDLAEATNELQPMIRRLIGEDIQCEFMAADTPLLVLIDPGQFEQVVLNLVINARDAMPGGGRLAIATGLTTLDPLRAADLATSAGDYVVFSVADTGEGIDPKAREFIFEPFFTTKAPGIGTGLGLSTVFGIVRQSGGAIDVESELGRGSIFRVFLPVTPATTPDAEPAISALRAETGAATILLAEDEDGVRGFLELALRRAGHTVIATSTGPDAVEAGLQHDAPIDLLIADVVMPGMSGPEVAERLRHKHKEMRTIYLSGYAALPDRVIAEVGAFLQKPFTVDALLVKIAERLARP